MGTEIKVKFIQVEKKTVKNWKSLVATDNVMSFFFSFRNSIPTNILLSTTVWFSLEHIPRKLIFIIFEKKFVTVLKNQFLPKQGDNAIKVEWQLKRMKFF